MSNHPRNIWMISRLTLREAWRRRLLWIAAGLGLAFLILFGIGFWAAHRDIVQSMDPEGPVAEGAFSTFIMLPFVLSWRETKARIGSSLPSMVFCHTGSGPVITNSEFWLFRSGTS